MFCHKMPCCLAIEWAIDVLVRSSGLCSVARCAMMPLCLLASPVNLFLRVLKVSNIAIVDLSSFNLQTPSARLDLTECVNILICWFPGLISHSLGRVKWDEPLPMPNNTQHLLTQHADEHQRIFRAHTDMNHNFQR